MIGTIDGQIEVAIAVEVSCQYWRAKSHPCHRARRCQKAAIATSESHRNCTAARADCQIKVAVPVKIPCTKRKRHAGAEASDDPGAGREAAITMTQLQRNCEITSVANGQ